MDGITDSGVIDGYASAVLDVGRAEGNPDGITDELYKIARAVEGSAELHDTLADPRVPVERKQAVLTDVLDGRASRASIALVTLLVGAGRTSDLNRIAKRAVDLAAESERLTVAEVRSAVDLDAATVGRLEETLAAMTGKRIRANVIVDPSLVGGIVTKVGDMVIDGSVRSRLQDLREAWG
ncbi:MAG TPA: ATP synthase F1 subunit delta [Acidimicrobiia bacterium]|jgi:F-type H+-transporting ATPase subunit delta